MVEMEIFFYKVVSPAGDKMYIAVNDYRVVGSGYSYQQAQVYANSCTSGASEVFKKQLEGQFWKQVT